MSSQNVQSYNHVLSHLRRCRNFLSILKVPAERAACSCCSRCRMCCLAEAASRSARSLSPLAEDNAATSTAFLLRSISSSLPSAASVATTSDLCQQRVRSVAFLSQHAVHAHDKFSPSRFACGRAEDLLQLSWHCKPMAYLTHQESHTAGESIILMLEDHRSPLIAMSGQADAQTICSI